MHLSTVLQAVAAAATFAVPSLAVAQGAQVNFGEGQRDPDAPVEVVADQLDFDQDGGTAVFTGNVVITQGTLRLAGDKVDVVYGAGPTGENRIERVDAAGSVTMFNGDEAAEAERAIYTVVSGVVVMTGDVLLTQGTNTIAGEQLTVNVDTGQGVMEGRVRVLFNQGPEDAGGASQ
ncbi:MAG: lipopolysaccharide transport periplasmic protein LptA [Pseudomonadota bacterium]